MRLSCRNRGNHGATACHSAHRHSIGRATAGHRCRFDSRRRARNGHVTRGKISHGFTEHHGENDWRAVRWVVLARRLVDRHRWCRSVVDHRVVGARGRSISISHHIMRLIGRNCRNYGSVHGHPTHSHSVVFSTARDRCRCRSGRTAKGHIAGGKVGHRFAEYNREVDERSARRICLGGRLVDGHRRGIMIDRGPPQVTKHAPRHRAGIMNRSAGGDGIHH